MAQLDPEPNYDQMLQERAIAYLQTKDWRLFPFSEGFDAAQRKAFIRDLRDGLAELTDSGSARKTSATGFIMSDQRLRDIVREWAAAKGGWPAGANPRARVTAVTSLAE